LPAQELAHAIPNTTRYHLGPSMKAAEEILFLTAPSFPGIRIVPWLRAHE
jgi:hypothetical protein